MPASDGAGRERSGRGGGNGEGVSAWQRRGCSASACTARNYADARAERGKRGQCRAQRMLSQAAAYHHQNEIRRTVTTAERRETSGNTRRKKEAGQGHVRLDAISTHGTYGQEEASAEIDDVLVATTRNADEVRQQQRRVPCHRGRRQKTMCCSLVLRALQQMRRRLRRCTTRA